MNKYRSPARSGPEERENLGNLAPAHGYRVEDFELCSDNPLGEKFETFASPEPREPELYYETDEKLKYFNSENIQIEIENQQTYEQCQDLGKESPQIEEEIFDTGA